MSDLIEIAPVGATIGPYVILTKAYRAENGLWFIAVRVDGQFQTVRASKVINAMLGGRAIATRRRELPALYACWESMRRRCYHPWAADYRWYGARGVRICPDWIRSFDAFAAFALANGWRPDLTIDRIRSDGNYEPRNVRFVDRLTQNRNRRRCGRLAINADNLNRIIAQTMRDVGVPARERGRTE